MKFRYILSFLMPLILLSNSQSYAENSFFETLLVNFKKWQLQPSNNDPKIWQISAAGTLGLVAGGYIAKQGFSDMSNNNNSRLKREASFFVGLGGIAICFPSFIALIGSKELITEYNKIKYVQNFMLNIKVSLKTWEHVYISIVGPFYNVVKNLASSK